MNIKIYQIFYNEETREKVDPLYIPLDNSDNPKPEWFEFYPIKNFLDNNELEDNTYYGFLSPRFQEKTKVSAQDLINLINSKESEQIDVFLSSIEFGAMSYCQNVFIQGDVCHPGLLSLSQKVFDKIGLYVDLTKLVTNAQTAAYCNYIIAKKEYWLEWKKIADKFYDLVEYNPGELASELYSITDYARGPSPMRTFIQERIPGLILSNNRFKTYTFGEEWDSTLENTFSIPFLYQLCNFFKGEYIRTNNPLYLIVFEQLHDLITQQEIKKRANR